MKTERRHEVEENSLARGLADWGDRLRPYSNAILIGIAALLLVYVGVSMWSSYQAKRNQSAWEAFEAALMESDADQHALQRLTTSEDHQGTEMQEWALMGWADRQLLRASQMYLTNRDEANNRLTNILEIYKQYATGGSVPEIRNRARLGLARAYEMKGNLEEARKNYAMVEGGLQPIAAARIKELETKEAQEAVKWLATAPLPKPTTPGGPGTPGKRPGFEGNLPATDAAAASGATADTLKDILGRTTVTDTSGKEPTGEAPKAGEPAKENTPPAATDSKPAADDAKNSSGAATPATDQPKAADQAAASPAAPADKPAEKPAEAPASTPAAPAAK
jgi:hypothetical protein